MARMMMFFISDEYFPYISLIMFKYQHKNFGLVRSFMTFVATVILKSQCFLPCNILLLIQL
jgi:hypothetical protein